MNTDTKARGVPSTKANNEGEQKGEQKNQKKREKRKERRSKRKDGRKRKKKKPQQQQKFHSQSYVIVGYVFLLCAFRRSPSTQTNVTRTSPVMVRPCGVMWINPGFDRVEGK